MAVKKDMQTSIVLQGGGALGAYEVGALERLYEEKDFSPQIVSGVSIGAVNAAVLASSDSPVETLKDLWSQFEVMSSPFIPDVADRFLSLVGNLNFYRMRYDYFMAPFWTSLYSTEPLRDVLNRFVDFRKINDPHRSRRLIITAVNIESGQIEIFDNRKDRITIDHILASGSLPPGFPMTRIGGNYYWDGGLFSNTPLWEVVECLDSDPARRKRIIIFNLFPGRGHVPSNMLDVFERMVQILFSSKFQFDINALERVNQFVESINEIDKSLPEVSPIRNLPGYGRMKKYKFIEDVVIVQNENPEIVYAPFDFSRKSIYRRMQAGYSDACNALEKIAVIEYVRENNARGVEEILQRNPEFLNDRTMRADGYRGSLMHFAVRMGQEEVVRYLLSQKADINKGDVNDETPLKKAMKRGYAGIAELLRAHGGKEEPGK